MKKHLMFGLQVAVCLAVFAPIVVFVVLIFSGHLGNQI